MKKRILIIFLSIVLIGTTHTGIVIADTIIHKKEIQKAYSILCNANKYSDGATGYAGTISNEIHAYAKLYKRKSAKIIFKKLEKEANAEGKIYALCALYYFDHSYYKKLIKRYEVDNSMIKSQWGCMIAITPMSEFIIDFQNDNYPRVLKEYITRDYRDIITEFIFPLIYDGVDFFQYLLTYIS